MSKKKLVLVFVNIILLLAGLGLMLTFFVLEKQTKFDIFTYLGLGVFGVTVVLGVLYPYMDFKKDASVFYKGFMYSSTIYYALTVASLLAANEKVSPCIIIPAIGAYVLLLVLSVGKDMGRKASLAMAIIIVLCSLLPMVYYAVDYGKIGEMSKRLLFVYGSKLCLGVVTSVMIIAKYVDKKERGRKV